MTDSVYILGISAFYHDSAACLIRDGRVVAAVQEERFSRKKHDPAFPTHAVQYCLDHAGIGPDELKYVCFYDKPWLKFERLLETYLNFAPSGIRSFLMAMPIWLKEKLWMESVIEREVGFQGKVLFPEHHQSHAASAFFPSPFESAAILTLDGVGEWATSTFGVGRGSELTLTHELNFPHSVGLLYSAFTYYIGFKVNSGEYKVMGLAPYGEPRFVDTILNELMDLKEDGSFRLNMKYFNYCQGLTMTSKAFDGLFGGPPRAPESELSQREMDLARSVQEVTEEVMVRMARHVRKTTGERFLCLAGGVALNCVGNGRILGEEIFEDMWIQPAAGDAGGALGAALYAWHHVEGGSRSVGPGDAQFGSYLGPSFSSEEIRSWLDEKGYPYHLCDDPEAPDLAAELIERGKVVGWFMGRMEFGPRALGARSIIGDARSPSMQSVMNRKIKYRESFRPFAPSCLEEDASALFELTRTSPYMLLVSPVKEELRHPIDDEAEGLVGLEKLKVPRSEIPAVTHVDFSARVQTVNQGVNPRFHRLIQAFKERTGYGVIINTSFNVRGEPIVCTPGDAYQCFMRTEMDALVMEDIVLHKCEQPPLNEDTDWRDRYEID